MEFKECSYEEFPISELEPEGMKTIKADRSSEFPKIKLNVKYGEKSDQKLHLQMIFPPMEFEEMQSKEKKFSLIVYILGSAWRTQELG